MDKIVWVGSQYLPDGETFWVTLRLLYNIATILALIWILWRAFQVLRRPTEELIEVLGIEVPESPNVSLAGIEENSVRVIWSKPNPQDTVIKYQVQVNGCKGKSLLFAAFRSS